MRVWLSPVNPRLIRVWLQVFRQNFSSRFDRKFKFKFCSRYSNKSFVRASRESFLFQFGIQTKIFLRASRENLTLSSIFQLFQMSRFTSYQGIQMAHLAKH